MKKTKFTKHPQTSNFMKACPVAIPLLHSDGRTNTYEEAGSRFSQMFGERAWEWKKWVEVSLRKLKKSRTKLQAPRSLGETLQGLYTEHNSAAISSLAGVQLISNIYCSKVFVSQSVS